MAQEQLRTSILPEASFFMVMRSNRQWCGGAASEPWRLTDWNISVGRVFRGHAGYILFWGYAVLFWGHVLFWSRSCCVVLRSCCVIIRSCCIVLIEIKLWRSEVILCYFLPLLRVPTQSYISCCDMGTFFESYGITFTFIASYRKWNIYRIYRFAVCGYMEGWVLHFSFTYDLFGVRSLVKIYGWLLVALREPCYCRKVKGSYISPNCAKKHHHYWSGLFLGTVWSNGEFSWSYPCCFEYRAFGFCSDDSWYLVVGSLLQ